jgi:hypothetical protein
MKYVSQIILAAVFGLALAACSGGGGGGNSGTQVNCALPQYSGSPGCLNQGLNGGGINGRQGIGFNGLGVGFYQAGLPYRGSAPLTILGSAGYEWLGYSGLVSGGNTILRFETTGDVRGGNIDDITIDGNGGIASNAKWELSNGQQRRAFTARAQSLNGGFRISSSDPRTGAQTIITGSPAGIGMQISVYVQSVGGTVLVARGVMRPQ